MRNILRNCFHPPLFVAGLISILALLTNTTYAQVAPGARQTDKMQARPVPPLPRVPDAGPGWNASNVSVPYQLQNRRGYHPITHYARNTSPFKEKAVGPSNYLLTIPFLDLPGRGLSLSLSLFYNSNLWTVNDTDEYVFDHDKGWPAPGWSLGFGKAIMMGFPNVALEDADGTLHPSKTLSTTYNSSGSATVNEYATDGSLIDSTFTSFAQRMEVGVARYPNGAEVQFGASSGEALYPLLITDANGNSIAIAYKNNVGPQIDHIRDTLGRVVAFQYDSNNLLTAITAPGLKTPGVQSPPPRVLVRLHYQSMSLNTTALFQSAQSQGSWLTVASPLYAIDAVYFPGTSTGYWFGDPNSYSPYGMISKVSQRSAMSATASTLNDQGTITGGSVLREKVYNYPASIDPAAFDTPTYSTMTETWAGMDVPPAVTNYTAGSSFHDHLDTVTYPDGTYVEKLRYGNQLANRAFLEGMLYQVSTYSDATKAMLMQQVTTAWEKGENGTPRVTSVKTTDRLNQTTTTTYAYSGPHNQVQKRSKLDYDGTTVLGYRSTTFVSDPNYEALHIFNLPKEEDVVNSSEYVATGQYQMTTFGYDEGILAQTPPLVNHTTKHTKLRGDLTSVTRLSNASFRTGPIVETRQYDDAGNIVSLGGSCCVQASFEYSTDSWDTYPSAERHGALSDATAQLSTSSSYDVDTGLVTSTTDANGRVTALSYDPASLRPTRIVLPTGASIAEAYDDADREVIQTVTDASGNVAGEQRTTLNGLGLVMSQAVLTDNYICDLNAWSNTDTHYDQMGRVQATSQPYFPSQNGLRSCGEQPVWNQFSYDPLGRITRRIDAYGGVTSTVYDDGIRPSSSDGAPGNTMRTTDAWGRERWYRTNALGQLAEVIEPNAASSGKVSEPGNTATHYTYNSRRQILHVVQGPDQQERRFAYDSIGRLIAQALPEKSATLDGAGKYVGTGGLWSDVFAYDDRSNLTVHTDARGIKTVNDFGNPVDALNRPQGVSYDTTGFGDTSNPVVPTPPSTYQYMPGGDTTRVFAINTPPLGSSGFGASQIFGYDTEGRLASKQITYSGFGPSMILAYNYDSLGRIQTLTYPTEAGNASVPGSKVGYTYGVRGLLNDVKVSGVEFASQVVYDAAGLMTSLSTGPAGPAQITERYDYDPYGLLTDQHIFRGTLHLLDQAYDYKKSGTTSVTGQLTGITSNSTPYRTYAYDALGRLSAALGYSNHFSWTEVYLYDPYGNRTEVKSGGQSATGAAIPNDGAQALTYDTKSNHIIAGSSPPAFTYDAAGNQTGGVSSAGLLNYQYDAANRLSNVIDRSTGNVLESFGYGLDRHRLFRSGTSQTPIYSVWNGDQELAEYKPVGNSLVLSSNRVYLGGRLLATRVPGASGPVVSYHHPDRLGSRIITTDPYSTAIPNVTLPFGTIIADESGAAPNPIFTSYDRSGATGLDDAVNRTYDYLQRFIQADPVEMNAVTLADPQSLNLYLYVRNDPVNRIDPAGEADSTPERVCLKDTDGKAYCYDLTNSGNSGSPGGSLPSDIGPTPLPPQGTKTHWYDWISDFFQMIVGHGAGTVSPSAGVGGTVNDALVPLAEGTETAVYYRRFWDDPRWNDDASKH